MPVARYTTFVDEKLADGSANPAYDPATSPDLESAVLNPLQDHYGAAIDLLRSDHDTALAGKAPTNHGHSIGDVSGLQAQLDLKAAKRGVPIVAQTGTAYTPVVADAGSLITLDNAAAITVTLPASVFAAGDVMRFLWLGAGQPSFAVGTGLTLNSEGPDWRKVAARYTSVTVTYLSATRAVLEGSLAA